MDSSPSARKKEISSKQNNELTETQLRLRDKEDSRLDNSDRGNVSPPRSERFLCVFDNIIFLLTEHLHNRSHKSGNSVGTTASTMLDVKNNRKRAEADLQLLANRIALLRVMNISNLTLVLNN